MIPIAPSNAQLQTAFTIAASGRYIDGSLAIFVTDHIGTINQIAP